MTTRIRRYNKRMSYHHILQIQLRKSGITHPVNINCMFYKYMCKNHAFGSPILTRATARGYQGEHSVMGCRLLTFIIIVYCTIKRHNIYHTNTVLSLLYVDVRTTGQIKGQFTQVVMYRPLGKLDRCMGLDWRHFYL